MIAFHISKMNYSKEGLPLMTESTQKPLIQVLDRAMNILELLAQEGKALQLMEISERTGLGVKTTNHILRSLFDRGYVCQNENRAYMLGIQCVWLGIAADRHLKLRKAAVPVINKIFKETGFTVFLGILESDKLFCIALKANALSTQRGVYWQRWAEELHSTASGRVLLANLNISERSRLLARSRRKKLTRKTIIAPQKLEEICAQVQVDGYAEVIDQSVEKVCSMAVPVKDASGRTVGALTISHNKNTWAKISLHDRLQILRQGSRAISTRL